MLAIINRSILSCGLLSTRKWYIMKFLKLSILLLTFIYIYISLKTSNILENKSQAFERSDCTITVRNDLYLWTCNVNET